MKECLAGLSSAGGYLKRHLARELAIKQIPALIFSLHHGVFRSSRAFSRSDFTRFGSVSLLFKK
jgi:ribosome-binding factor A